MQTIRAFIAIHLPQEVQTYLGEVSRNAARDVPTGAVRWVKPELMHLTLCFLGDTPVERLPALKAALDDAAANRKPFELRLDKLGCFPNASRPRVVWVGVAGALSAAQSLKAALDDALEPLGWQPEGRPFQAHLTLGRVKHSNDQIRLPWGRAVDPLSIPVAEIYLVQSDLRPSGPVYTDRHAAGLAA